MSVMTIPEAWYGQDRMLTVEDITPAQLVSLRH
jgi:hypothetical protein